MPLFGGKKKEIPPMQAGPAAEPTPDMAPYDTNNIPVDSVLSYRQQGLTNDQIVQALQRDGYTSEQIFEAVNQADIKGSIESMPSGQLEQMGALDNPMPQQYEQYQPPQMPPPMMGMPAAGGGSPRGERTEEIVEAIVNEKWEEMTKNLAKIMEWKEKSESSITKLEQSMTDLRSDYDKLHQAVVGKVSEYDKNIINVGTEIKAMEKVFQKILPTLTENVNELSMVTKQLKRK